MDLKAMEHFDFLRFESTLAHPEEQCRIDALRELDKMIFTKKLSFSPIKDGGFSVLLDKEKIGETHRTPQNGWTVKVCGLPAQVETPKDGKVWVYNTRESCRTSAGLKVAEIFEQKPKLLALIKKTKDGTQ